MFDDLREFVYDAVVTRTDDVARAELLVQIGEVQQIFRSQRATMMMVPAMTMPVIGHGDALSRASAANALLSGADRGRR